MPSFVHYALLWGLPVIGVPVLIHLINMLRHKRVEWAAMEFLLLSQKKHRTWVILKQLLLLLMRMLAVAAVVLVVAQPLVRNEWGNLLGSTRTHHIILLDDSYSMSDRWGDTSAFAQAKKVVEQVVTAAARQQQSQSLTLLRFSRAGQYGGGLRADFTKESVDADLAKRLSEKLAAMDASQTAAEPLAALGAIAQLLGDDQGERRIIYLVSDFRARQWDEPAELKKRLADLNQAQTELHLVHCVDASHANLGIAALEPEEGLRAAGMKWRMQVAVRNFGTTAVANVPVLLTEDGKARAPVTIAEIPAGGTAKEQFDVYFPDAGEHVIAAKLEADAVAADNSRYAVVDLPTDMPVLLVDGDPAVRDAKYLQWVLAGGRWAHTGLRPRIETTRFLATRPLDEFRTVTVCNFNHLDRTAVEKLEEYVKAGGGVAFFLGEQTTADAVNRELYRDGAGLFPLPLAGPADLLLDRLEKVPDMQGDDHFIFRYLGKERNEHLGAVLVERYLAARKGWKPPSGSTVKEVIHLRNGAPLMVEQAYGKGRVVAFLSTAAPVWNNWASSNETGSFPVMATELQVYLARRPAADTAYQVGGPLELKLDAGQYQPQVRFVTPAEDTMPTATIDAVRTDGQLTATLPHAEVAGCYQARLTTLSGKPEVRRFAINVDPAEGDLKTMLGPDLAARLSPEVKYEFAAAATFQSGGSDPTGRNLKDLLLYLLVALLIGEQILAWSASYHPARPGETAKGGKQSPPLPLGEGRGEGGNGRVSARAAGQSRHPNPLPAGEGTPRSLPEGEGTAVAQGGGR